MNQSPIPTKRPTSRFHEALDEARKRKQEIDNNGEPFYVPRKKSKFEKIFPQVLAIIIFTVISLTIVYSLFLSFTSEN